MVPGVQSPDKEKTDIADHLELAEAGDAEKVAANQRGLHNAALYEAIRESNIRRWSKTSIHLYFAIFIAFCCSCANGYDGTLFAGLLSMPHFQSTFKSGTTGSKVSTIASLYTVGQIVGSPTAAIISDRFGRRIAMFCGAVLIIVGMIITATANTIAQFTVGRFILGFGVTQMTVSAPAYTMEIAPPHWRGRCTGLYNCGWYGGSIPAAAVTFGTNFIDNDYSWRIPIILQAFACTIVLGAVFTIPESPRFLMANGRDAEAHDFLVKYHGGGNPNSTLVALEIAEFRAGIMLDGSDKRWWDYRPLFSKHSSRWRMYQVILMSVAGQFSGNGLAYFNTVIYAKLGISTVTKQLAYNLLYACVSAIGAFIGAGFSDKMPRRKALVYGTLACAGWLAICAGLQTEMANKGAETPKSVAQGALAAYFLFSFTIMFTYTPLQAVIPAEALETTNRAKGLAVSTSIVGVMGFINQFCGPIALQNISYKYFWVFVGWDVVEAGFWYLFGVEGQGRTLEEMEWVYEQPNPVRASLRIDKAAAT